MRRRPGCRSSSGAPRSRRGGAGPAGDQHRFRAHLRRLGRHGRPGLRRWPEQPRAAFAAGPTNRLSDWRTAILNEQDEKQRFHIPDYEAVKTKTHTYVRWKTGERELYDLQKDPYELENIEDKADPVTLARLKTRLQMLSACRGSACRAGEGP